MPLGAVVRAGGPLAILYCGLRLEQWLETEGDFLPVGKSQGLRSRAGVVGLLVRGSLHPFVFCFASFSRWATILMVASRSSVAAEVPAISTKFLGAGEEK